MSSVTPASSSAPNFTMKKLIIWLCYAVVGSLFVAACIFAFPGPSGPAKVDWSEEMLFQAPDGKEIPLNVDVVTVVEQNTGYAGYTKAPEPGRGLLFQSSVIKNQTVTMRDVPFGISVMWFDDKGRTVGMEELPSCDHEGFASVMEIFCPVYESPMPSSDVLLFRPSN